METRIDLAPIGCLKPYPDNPRDNSLSIAKVAASIREFGFLQPIVADNDGVIIVGHTRYEAAKTLGLTEVPVVFARHLSEAQARAYRLADNRVGESSKWIEEILDLELEALSGAFDFSELGFGEDEEEKAKKAWTKTERLCTMKKKIVTREKMGALYTTFLATGKEGRSLEDIKADKSAALLFGENLADWIRMTLGNPAAAGSWAILTTPRRRHQEGMHFATEVCKEASRITSIPFYPDVIRAENRQRINPVFTLASEVKEPNVILYDDIVTTGSTLLAAREALMSQKHTVLMVASIRNS